MPSNSSDPPAGNRLVPCAQCGHAVGPNLTQCPLCGHELVSSPLDPAEGLTGTATPSSAQSTATIGSYRLLQRLGQGGMGEVWLAEQTRPVHRRVAVKLIKPGMDSDQVIARFEAERQALALMDHPAIATVFDGGTTPEGRLYFAMEYVKGEPITVYCDRHKLPVRERLALFLHVCQGVQHAHQKGIIHRDLKPSNVMVTLVDDRPVPKIIDFGVAKATAQHFTGDALFTELGAMLGTPEYMSPEQAEMGGLDIDTRTDVYALGVLLYVLLTGALPFESDSLRAKGLDEIRRTIREVDPPKPSTRVSQMGTGSTAAGESRGNQPARLAGQLRGDLDWITMKALEKDRTHRYDTIMGLANDVRRHLDNEPVTAGPPSTLYRARKFVRRHRFGVGAAATLVLLVAAFGVTMAFQAQRIARERDRANREATVSKQVSDFLVGLFKVSDPSEARGNTLTAREILTRGALQLDSLRDQPAVHARLQATIGGVFTGLGLYADAQPLLEGALQTQRRVLGEDSPESLATANDLANAYWYQNRYEEAEPLYRDIVQRRTRVLGKDHPETLRANFDLASLYLQQKRLGEFESLARDTLARQRRVLGGAHSDTLSSLNNLQNFYFLQGRYAEAEQLAVEVLDGRRRLLGEEHPATLRALHNLAAIYRELGRYSEAESLFLKALEAKRRVLGDEHPDTCRTLDSMASMYMKQRRYREAESAALAAYHGYVKRLGDHNEKTRLVVGRLVALYAAAGQPDKAKQWRAKLPREPTQ